jgi:hypothetical protein
MTSAFQHLIHIGIVERVSGRLTVSGRLATQRQGGANKVVDASCLLILLESEPGW